jgi:hypothetical protein
MSNEIQFDGGATGLIVYSVLRNSVAQVYNLLSGTFETFTSGSYSGAYPISGTEQGINGYYVANFPSGIIPGFYNLVGKQQGGGFPLQTDVTLADGDLWWTGSGIQTFPTNFNDLSITPAGLVSITSGPNVVVPPASLSGVVANSGLFVNVPIATISGVQPISGTTVSVPIASISGNTSVVLPATLSGVVANSGLFVNVPIATISGVNVVASVSVPSGSLYLASGSIFINTFASGVVGGGSGNLPSAWGNSGAVTIGQNLDKTGYTLLSGLSYTASGLFVNVPTASISGVTPSFVPAVFSGIFSGNFVVIGSVLSGVFSGQQVTLTSGQSYTASGINAVVPPSTLSGVNVIATTASGTLYLASGSIFMTTFASGVVGGGSGNLPNSWGASGSVTIGQNLDKTGYTLTSGLSYTASGINVSVPIASISGAVANSGLFVNVPISTISGVNVVASQASGTTFLASGSFLFGSGQFYLASGSDYLPSGSIFATTFASGVLAQSGQIYLASGTPLFYSGLYYVASGSVTASVSSGSLYLASGSIFKNTFASGVLGTSGGLPTAWGNSGAVTDGQNLDKSGYTANSGIFASVPIATISGLTANSGLFVNVPIGTISGVNSLATIQSGTTYLNSGYVLSNSGQFYVASGSVSAVVPSGSVTLPSGSVIATVASGAVWLASGQAVSLNSGQVVSLYSGQSVNVYSGQLSGQPIAGLSGFIYPASGVNVTIPISSISGVSVVASQASGTTFLASGSFLFGSGQFYVASGSVATSIVSGQVWIASGSQVLVYSGQLSGQPVTTGSGLFVVVPTSTLSGVVANSGLFVNVPTSSISGTNVVATTASGSLYLASGWQKTLLTTDYSGLPTTPVHSLVNATRKLINRWDTTSNSGQLTVYLEDAASVAYMQPLTSQSGAQPIVSLGDS